MRIFNRSFITSSVMVFGAISLLSGCGSPKAAQTNVQPEEEGPPRLKQEFSIKAQDGGAIALKLTDGSHVKIIFPQGSLESDSELEVAERTDRDDEVFSDGFTLNLKGSEEGPELKYPALIVFTLDKELPKEASNVRYNPGGSFDIILDKDFPKEASIVRYKADGSFDVIPTRVSSKDGKTSLIAQVDHFSDYGTRLVDPDAIQSAKDSQEAKDFNWVIYSQDSYDIDAGAMKRKVNLDFKAVNTSGDLAGEYKGYAHATTANDMDIGDGGVTADSSVNDDNVSFTLEPYVELADLVERDDDLANLEPEKMPDLMGQGSLNMRGAGSGTVSARGRTYSAGLKVQDSHDAMTVAVTGPLVRLTVTVNGIGTMYFDGYIRGEGK